MTAIAGDGLWRWGETGQRGSLISLFHHRFATSASGSSHSAIARHWLHSMMVMAGGGEAGASYYNCCLNHHAPPVSGTIWCTCQPPKCGSEPLTYSDSCAPSM